MRFEVCKKERDVKKRLQEWGGVGWRDCPPSCHLSPVFLLICTLSSGLIYLE